MFHKKGNIFQRRGQGAVSPVEYREAIAAALTHELGGAGRAAKTTIKWTGVTERTAKNWISSSYGPSGENLLELMRHSDAVFFVVLGLAGRNEALTISRIEHIKQNLEGVLQDINAICGSEGG